MLGECFSTGRGTKQDYAAAVNWYSQAAAQDYLQAQLKLAAHYEEAKDYPEAVKWYRMAAKQGDAGAQNNLALCYEKGCGVTVNAGEAAYWYNKAAVQGYKEAQANLGRCYRDGLGVAKDQAKAREWFRKAANQGFEPAKKMLDGLPKENLINKKEPVQPNSTKPDASRQSIFSGVIDYFDDLFFGFDWWWFGIVFIIGAIPLIIVSCIFWSDACFRNIDDLALLWIFAIVSVVGNALLLYFRETIEFNDFNGLIFFGGLALFVVTLVLLPFLNGSLMLPFAVLSLGFLIAASIGFGME